MPQTVDNALTQIITMTKRKGRWYEGYEPKKDSLEKRGIVLGDLPDIVHKQLKSVTRQIGTFRDAAEREFKLTVPQTANEEASLARENLRLRWGS